MTNETMPGAAAALPATDEQLLRERAERADTAGGKRPPWPPGLVRRVALAS